MNSCIDELFICCMLIAYSLCSLIDNTSSEYHTLSVCIEEKSFKLKIISA